MTADTERLSLEVIKFIAGVIVSRYNTSASFREKVLASNEPYRAMHDYSGCEALIKDGSDDYQLLVDEFENLICASEDSV